MPAEVQTPEEAMSPASVILATLSGVNVPIYPLGLGADFFFKRY